MNSRKKKNSLSFENTRGIVSDLFLIPEQVYEIHPVFSFFLFIPYTHALVLDDIFSSLKATKAVIISNLSSQSDELDEFPQSICFKKPLM